VSKERGRAREKRRVKDGILEKEIREERRWYDDG